MSFEDSPVEYNQTNTLSLSSVLQKVFLYMTGGLVITGITALAVVNITPLLAFALNSYWVWLIAELVLVIFLSARIQKMGSLTATLSFILYSIVNGVTLSTIFLVYTESSIASVFFITAGMFGVTALFGKATKIDLTKFGSYMIMALFGLIIAGIVNIFLGNNMVNLITAVVGVFVFIGLTAYDVQKIKNYSNEIGEDNSENTKKLVIMGALSLYLDFINIFLKLLSIFGKRKD